MLTCHPVPGKKKSADLCRLVAESAPASAKGHVFYGVKDGNLAEWRRVLRSGEDYYVIDNSYFDKARGAQYRVTKNHFQHRGEGPTTGDRFAALGYAIKPRREPGLRTLAVQQSPVHMACVAGDTTWLSRRMCGVNQDVRLRKWDADKLALQTSLHDDIAWAQLVVTHSSAAAIEALIEGVLVMVSPMSSAYYLTDFTDRQRFFGVLADNQWTLGEIAEGAIWK